MAKMKKAQHIHIEMGDGEGKGFHGAVVHVQHRPSQREGKHGMVSMPVESDSKVFGEDDGLDMLAHIANHAEIDEKENDNQTDQPEKGEGEDMPEPSRASAAGRMTKEKAARVREKAA